MPRTTRRPAGLPVDLARELAAELSTDRVRVTVEPEPGCGHDRIVFSGGATPQALCLAVSDEARVREHHRGYVDAAGRGW